MVIDIYGSYCVQPASAVPPPIDAHTPSSLYIYAFYDVCMCSYRIVAFLLHRWALGWLRHRRGRRRDFIPHLL